jgi:hypothetical protein
MIQQEFTKTPEKDILNNLNGKIYLKMQPLN